MHRRDEKKGYILVTGLPCCYRIISSFEVIEYDLNEQTLGTPFYTWLVTCRDLICSRLLSL